MRKKYETIIRIWDVWSLNLYISSFKLSTHLKAVLIKRFAMLIAIPGFAWKSYEHLDF